MFLLGLRNNIFNVFLPIWNKKAKVIKISSKQNYIFSSNIKLLLATLLLNVLEGHVEIGTSSNLAQFTKGKVSVQGVS